MARQLTTRAEINQFISTIIDAADHHAVGVNKVIKPLSDEILQRINLKIDRVDVYERDGKMARTCWVTINKKRYAFSYNYDLEKIELKNNNIQGSVRYRFDNTTGIGEIQNEVNLL